MLNKILLLNIPITFGDICGDSVNKSYNFRTLFDKIPIIGSALYIDGNIRNIFTGKSLLKITWMKQTFENQQNKENYILSKLEGFILHFLARSSMRLFKF